MSILSYEENGQTYWKYYLNRRSKKNPRIRLQRMQRGFKSRKEAEKEERFQLVQITSEIARLESQGCSWESIIDRWSQFNELYPSARIMKTTVWDYANLARKWTQSWLKRPASEITRGEGRLLLNQVADLGNTSAYQKKLKSVINLIYLWGIDERLIVGPHHSPVFGVDTTKKEQEKLPEILTHEQIKTLLREAKDRQHPWYPIWAVSVLTGCRNGEVFGLRHEDVELVSLEEASRQKTLPPHEKNFGLIRLTRSWNKRLKKYGPLKARYWRNVPVSSELYMILMELKQQNFGSDEHGQFFLPRFSTWKEGYQAKVLRAFCREIGIPTVRFHTLRACFATHLISRGVPSTTVMKICGWRDLKTAERYIRLAGVDERGATEGLDFIPNDQGIMEKVVNLYDYREANKNATL
jgi:integrase